MFFVQYRTLKAADPHVFFFFVFVFLLITNPQTLFWPFEQSSFPHTRQETKAHSSVHSLPPSQTGPEPSVFSSLPPDICVVG